MKKQEKKEESHKTADKLDFEARQGLNGFTPGGNITTMTDVVMIKA